MGAELDSDLLCSGLGGDPSPVRADKRTRGFMINEDFSMTICFNSKSNIFLYFG